MMRFYIGCSGFYNAHWKGIFYPDELARSGWLAFYASQLHSLELNNTFYRFPGLKAMQNWHDKVPEDFCFSVKAPKIITHLKKLQECGQLLNDFYSVCEQGLRDKLGCLLFQFPPGIAYSEAFLEKILLALKPGFRNVVEFLHESWWRPEVYEALREHKISFCSISHPTLPGEIITTSETAYVRLHGTPRMFYSNYSPDQLEKLHEQLTKRKQLKEVFVYFNNTAGPAGIQNALQLKKRSSESSKLI